MEAVQEVEENKHEKSTTLNFLGRNLILQLIKSIVVMGTSDTGSEACETGNKRRCLNNISMDDAVQERKCNVIIRWSCS